MAKLVLLSGLMGLIVGPILASRASNPRRALKALLLYTAIINLAYLIGLKFIFLRLS